MCGVGASLPGGCVCRQPSWFDCLSSGLGGAPVCSWTAAAHPSWVRCVMTHCRSCIMRSAKLRMPTGLSGSESLIPVCLQLKWFHVFAPLSALLFPAHLDLSSFQPPLLFFSHLVLHFLLYFVRLCSCDLLPCLIVCDSLQSCL